MTSIHTAYGGTLSLTTSPMTVGWIFSIPSKGGQAITAEAVILRLTTSPMTVGWIFSISFKYEQAITAESGTLSMLINGREQRF
tara:strand:+ start:638 stop:889 length:252 start_codon:yes stop_codon:yes gene_type:complete